VEISEFEGRLDPDEFLEWLQTVERVFECEEVPKDKKVKLLALKLRKMSPYVGKTWLKRLREVKANIRSWEKMRSKLRLKKPEVQISAKGPGEWGAGFEVKAWAFWT